MPSLLYTAGYSPRLPCFSQAGKRSKRRGKGKEHWIEWNILEDKREEIEGKIGAIKIGKELKGREEHREKSPGSILSTIHGFISSFPKGFVMPMSFVSVLILPDSPSITSFISFFHLSLYLLFFHPSPMSSKFKAKVISVFR